MSIENAFAVCQACGRGEVELPVVSGRAEGMCPGCYEAISVRTFRCGACGDLLDAAYEEPGRPGTCGDCAAGVS